MEKHLDLARMSLWLVVGLVMYACAYLIGSNAPAVQTLFYKL